MLGALEEARRAGEAPVAQIAVHALDELPAPEVAQPRAEALSRLDEALAQAGEADAAMAWVYPHLLDSERPVKLTASGLLREAEGPRELPAMAERPQFMQETGLTGAERGSAYHPRLADAGDRPRCAASTGLRLKRPSAPSSTPCGRQTASARPSAPPCAPERLARFFAGETGKRLLQSDTVRREWPFNVRMKVEEALGDSAHARYGGGKCWCRARWTAASSKRGEWVLLDYKTDITRDREALVRHYEKQLAIYALALERITGLPVAGTAALLLASGEEITL